MSNKSTNTIAIFLLLIMFLCAFFSYQGDSLTMDELSHIPAGYSYLSQKDYRINPEHPPLIKDLAALPLLFLNLNFPKDSSAWTDTVNGQWWYGWELMYNSGNNPDIMIFWARLPMIFILVFLGLFLFYWTKKEFGNKVALLVLTLFSFSPTFLAHGRYVTTDVGATLGILLSLYFWLKFLKEPTKKNVILTGLIFGLSMLFKFSTILLIPLFAIITLTYVLLKKESLLKYLGLSLIIGLIGVIFVMMPVYQFHVLNYPPQKQLADTLSLLESSPLKLFKNICIWMSDKPIFRTIGHYFLGLLMATQRTAFGNTVYFMDMVSASGWWYYFPVVYFLKVPLAFHVLTLIALMTFAISIKEPFWVRFKKRTRDWILNNFTQFSMFIFLVIYWGTSISGRLNIGVRHILPTFPFAYILVSSGLILALNQIKRPFFKKIALSLMVVLIGWYIASSVNSFPYYLSHFNEIGGGQDEGYQYVVDSNYDWGQDLKRLALWVKANNIDKIKVDYFGGGDIDYYLGDKVERFDSLAGPKKGWLAISATPLQGGRGNPVPNFNQPTGFYSWLNKYQPVARAGKSIFIYHID